MNLIERLRQRFSAPDDRDVELNRVAANSRSTLERVVRLVNPELTDKEIRLKVLDAIVDARTLRHRDRN